MKKTKIVVPALAVLLLSTAASVSGTVAWFSMNTSVTVTGMSVTTKVSSNLQIAAINQEANYTDSIEQQREGVIEPSSSINGASGTFYYTTAAKGDGDAKTDVYRKYNEAAVADPDNSLASADAAKLGKTNFDSAFNSAYDFAYNKSTNNGTDKVAFAYIDYSFYLKGTSSEAGQKVVMTKCNMLYNGLAITTSYAWRVAMFAQPVEMNDNNTTVTDATATAVANVASYQKTILDFGSGKSANQTADTAINNLNNDNSDVMDDVVNPRANAVVGTIADAGETQRYKVVVRLWLEGEDKSCKNDTYADLTESWTLDLEFKLGKNDATDANDHRFDGVTVIGSEVPAQNP